MAPPLSRILTRVAYGATQLPRVAWYVGHGFALGQISAAGGREQSAAAPRRAHPDAPMPDRNRIYADMAGLFLQDLANVEAGIYPLPADDDGSWLTWIRRSRLFFDELP